MEFENIRAREIKDYIEKVDTIIIDLRDYKDYINGHIPMSVNIPFDEIERYMYELNKYDEIIFYCERGGNSLLASRKFSKLGYNIKNIYGGFLAYSGDISYKDKVL